MARKNKAKSQSELRLTKAIKSHARMTTTNQRVTQGETTIINTKINYNKNVSTSAKQNKKSQLKMFIAFARWNFQIKSKIKYPALLKKYIHSGMQCK